VHALIYRATKDNSPPGDSDGHLLGATDGQSGLSAAAGSSPLSNKNKKTLRNKQWQVHLLADVQRALDAESKAPRDS
jgi:hypothetical protein